MWKKILKEGSSGKAQEDSCKENYEAEKADGNLWTLGELKNKFLNVKLRDFKFNTGGFKSNQKGLN